MTPSALPEERVGHAIGQSIAKLPHLGTLNAGERRALDDLGIPEELVFCERLLLCACAAWVAVLASSAEAGTKERVLSGLQGYLAEQAGNPGFDYLPSTLPAALQHYYEAAAEDWAAGPSSETSQIVWAFSDRLLSLGKETPDRALACLNFATLGTREVWEVQASVALQMLADAEVIRPR